MIDVFGPPDERRRLPPDRVTKHPFDRQRRTGPGAGADAAPPEATHGRRRPGPRRCQGPPPRRRAGRSRSRHGPRRRRRCPSPQRLRWSSGNASPGRRGPAQRGCGRLRELRSGKSPERVARRDGRPRSLRSAHAVQDPGDPGAERPLGRPAFRHALPRPGADGRGSGRADDLGVRCAVAFGPRAADQAWRDRDAVRPVRSRDPGCRIPPHVGSWKPASFLPRGSATPQRRRRRPRPGKASTE